MAIVLGTIDPLGDVRIRIQSATEATRIFVVNSTISRLRLRSSKL